MVGDGESETGALATSWHSNKFLNPIRDGAVLPILHLNGYKINNPTLLARISHEELEYLFKGYGWTPHFVEGDDPAVMHQQMAATLEDCVLEIRRLQQEARSSGTPTRPRWPMIVLRSPKGWTGTRSRRPQGGRVLARPSRYRSRVCITTRPICSRRGLAAQLQARGVVRRQRAAAPGTEGACP